LAYLSYLRVAAIVGVVAIHVGGLTFINPDIPHDRVVWWVALVVDIGSAWAVPVFVMISGALLLEPVPGETPGDFYRRRLRRLGAPLVFWHLVYLAYRVVGLGQNLDPARILRDLLAAKTYTALYFFWLIAGLYVVTPVLRGFIASSTRRTVLMVAVGTQLLICGQEWGYRLLQMLHRDEGLGALVSFNYFIPFLGYYLLGYALRDLALTRRGMLLASIALGVATLEVCLQVAGYGPQRLLSTAMPPNSRGVAVITAALCVFLLGKTLFGPSSRWASRRTATRARRWGDLTFGVFVVHLLVLRGVQSLFDLPQGAVDLLALGGLLVATLGGAFAVAAILRRIPGLRAMV
jgi:surface polysaccharide O-acyltransferase-like enzyme